MRFNKAFGTAMKFWSGKLFATLLCYAILGFFVKQVADVWPRASDGSLAGIGHPSESVDRYSTKVRTKAKNAVETVRKKGLVEFLKETMTEIKESAGTRWNDVRENALTEESLRSRYTQLKEASKSLSETNGTYDTLKQLATEAKSTVTDQVQVDKQASTDRPLVATKSDSSDSVPNAAGRTARVVQEDDTDKKKQKMEVYVPRRRNGGTANPSSEDAPKVIARQPRDSAEVVIPSARNRNRGIPR